MLLSAGGLAAKLAQEKHSPKMLTASHGHIGVDLIKFFSKLQSFIYFSEIYTVMPHLLGLPTDGYFPTPPL